MYCRLTADPYPVYIIGRTLSAAVGPPKANEDRLKALPPLNHGVVVKLVTGGQRSFSLGGGSWMIQPQ